MIAVIDYRGGNIFSVTLALKKLGQEYIVTSDPEVILHADKVIFPGQGRASQAISALKKSGVWDIIPQIQNPFLGICLGMQLLFESSEEDDAKCLGMLPGKVKRFSGKNGLSVPQMGWNESHITKNDPIFSGISKKSFLYFANSYYAPQDEEYSLSLGSHGEVFSSIVRKENFYGMQFHPEKSGEAGMNLLKNFCSLGEEESSPKFKAFELLPAIDLIDGKCVRLTQGDYSQKTEYKLDPVEVAQKFEADGASVIHVIDLDGAKSGTLKNAETVIKIAKAVKIPVQTGGGIRTYDDAKMLLSEGISRIIIGTSAIQNTEFVSHLLNEFGPDRILVSVDARDGKVAIAGWEEMTNIPVMKFLEHLKAIGIQTIIFTDIAQDGMMKGPNFKSISEVQTSGLEIIVAGGVSSNEDIQQLKTMKVRGAIIGKAMYEGNIQLRDISGIGQNDVHISKNSEKLRITNYELRMNTDKELYKLSTFQTFDSGLTKRIIPCLDIAHGRVVKGTHFEELKDAGDPVELAQTYSDMGADELVFLDITATVEERKTLDALVKKIAETINIPFTVGGGIRSIEDIQRLLQCGADKVSIGSEAVRNPELIREASLVFGSQCIVISVDPKWNESLKKWEIYIKGGRENTGIDAIEFCKDMESLGAGELLVNSLDRDGTKSGYDIPLLQAISNCVSIPVIASSGAGAKEHFFEALTSGGADAVLAARLFHSGELTVGEVKEFLGENGVVIRDTHSLARNISVICD